MTSLSETINPPDSPMTGFAGWSGGKSEAIIQPGKRGQDVARAATEGPRNPQGAGGVGLRDHISATRSSAMSNLVKTYLPAAGLLIFATLSGCGHTMEERAATGAATGLVVAGPVGAAVGAGVGAAVDKVDEHADHNRR
jgi:hypothetical protein